MVPFCFVLFIFPRFQFDFIFPFMSVQSSIFVIILFFPSTYLHYYHSVCDALNQSDNCYALLLLLEPIQQMRKSYLLGKCINSIYWVRKCIHWSLLYLIQTFTIDDVSYCNNHLIRALGTRTQRIKSAVSHES